MSEQIVGNVDGEFPVVVFTIPNGTWVIEDSYQRSLEYPDTYLIPTDAERNSLTTCDLVKVSITYPGQRLPGERVWLMVLLPLGAGTDRGTRYLALMRSQPVFTCALVADQSAVIIHADDVADIIMDRANPAHPDFCAEMAGLVKIVQSMYLRQVPEELL